MSLIPKKFIIVGGGPSILPQISALQPLLATNASILTNYAFKTFSGSFLAFTDRDFYYPKPDSNNPNIYEDLKKLPLIIGINDNGVSEFKLDNTILLKRASDYHKEYSLEKGFYCYDKETEILTDQGWKYFKDLNKTEKVATLNITNDSVEYQKPINYICELYKGKMIYETGKRIDLLVTPNHKILFKKGHNQKKPPKKYYFIEAKDLKNNIMYRKSFPYRKGTNPKYFILPKLENNNKTLNYNSNASYYKVKYIKMEDWVEFLGWFISEGCCYYQKKGNYITVISQSKINNISKIRSCIKKCGFKFYEATDKGGINFRICNKQLYYYLSSQRGAKNKFIPREFLELDNKLLKILFKSLILGDGCVNGKSYTYYTSSKTLADNMFEIGLRLGYSPSLNIRNSDFYKVKNKKYNIKTTSYEIYFAKTEYSFIRAKKRKEIYYDDFVYCVEVPNHTLYIRRNGRACWCGNSGNLTGIFSIGLASYLMDYKGEIYLLGFDWNKGPKPLNKEKYTGYSDTKTHFYNDINHRGIGYTGYYDNHNPDKYFSCFLDSNLKIYNVSPDSNINLFEKIDYNTFFNKISNQNINQEKLRAAVKAKLTV